MQTRIPSCALVALALGACASGPARPLASGATSAATPGAVSVALPESDRIRIAEAFRLADFVGDSIWPGWTAAPFPMLLVTADREFLIRQANPSPDFARIGYDSLLQSDVFSRPRVFPPTLLATFPAVAGVPTIVIGQPGQTGKQSTAWVLTVLHEHFHQLQQSRPGYYDGVAALDLAHGDQTGMWMLNYPFPYDSAAVQSRFAEFAHALSAAVVSGSAGDVTTARDRLRASLTPPDYRYLAFQIWQEGVARYTELQVARLAARSYAPSPRFRALPDYTPFAHAAATLEQEIRDGTSAAALGAARRVSFYPVGASVALMLDATAPGWRSRYFDRGYSLDEQLTSGAR